MSIIRRSLCVAAFAFSLSAFGELIYYAGHSDSKEWYEYSGYAYADDFPSLVSSLFPSYLPNEYGIWCDPSDPDYEVISPIPQEDYFAYLSDMPYQPFSSDPAYASPIPSGPPSGGGSGGGGEGGFDPVGSLSGLSSFMSGLSSAVLGVLGVACFVFLSFIAWRKFRYSSKRV